MREAEPRKETAQRAQRIRVPRLVRLKAQGEPHVETKHLQMVRECGIFLLNDSFLRWTPLKDSTLAAINVSEIFN